MSQYSAATLGYIKKARRNEITEYHVYSRLAKITKNKENARILQKIGEEEKVHYNIWGKYSAVEETPSSWRIFLYTTMARFLGITFTLKLMERQEVGAQKGYDTLLREIPEAQSISKEEKAHETALLGMIDEELLRYVGSMVLGINDALVELTGSLAGFTLAFSTNRVIALVGLITGISAALSMAASEYMSTKHEGGDNNPLKAALYTGGAYVGVIILLIAPYLILTSPLISLVVTFACAVAIIFVFTFYLSVAKDMPFLSHFVEMTVISTVVTIISFGLGYILRIGLGVNA